MVLFRYNLRNHWICELGWKRYCSFVPKHSPPFNFPCLQHTNKFPNSISVHLTYAYLILEVNIRTLSDQLSHDVLAALLRMHHEGCRPVSPPLVHLCSLLDQLLHHLSRGTLEQPSTPLTSLEKNITLKIPSLLFFLPPFSPSSFFSSLLFPFHLYNPFHLFRLMKTPTSIISCIM